MSDCGGRNNAEPAVTSRRYINIGRYCGWKVKYLVGLITPKNSERYGEPQLISNVLYL